MSKEQIAEFELVLFEFVKRAARARREFLMAKKRKRDFEEVVQDIESAEEDVDKVLKAARLERYEKESFWESTAFVSIVFGIVMVLLAGGMIAFMILAVLFD